MFVRVGAPQAEAALSTRRRARILEVSRSFAQVSAYLSVCVCLCMLGVTAASRLFAPQTRQHRAEEKVSCRTRTHKRKNGRVLFLM